MYLSGKALIRENFFIKIIAENRIVKMAIIEAMFKLKLSVIIIALSVRISRHGLVIIKRNNPDKGFMAAIAKMQNKIINKIFETASKLISKKSAARKSQISKNNMAFFGIDICL